MLLEMPLLIRTPCGQFLFCHATVGAASRRAGWIAFTWYPPWLPPHLCPFLVAFCGFAAVSFTFRLQLLYGPGHLSPLAKPWL
jgi:hypothetical protein